MNKIILFLFIITLASPSNAMILEHQLEQLVGWTIVGSKQIKGHKARGKPYSDDFEGCDFGTIIYFSDGTALECNSYGYQYAFMPKAIIFGKGIHHQGKSTTIYRMLVQGQSYNMY